MPPKKCQTPQVQSSAALEGHETEQPLDSEVNAEGVLYNLSSESPARLGRLKTMPTNSTNDGGKNNIGNNKYMNCNGNNHEGKNCNTIMA